MGQPCVVTGCLGHSAVAAIAATPPVMRYIPLLSLPPSPAFTAVSLGIFAGLTSVSPEVLWCLPSCCLHIFLKFPVHALYMSLQQHSCILFQLPVGLPGNRNSIRIPLFAHMPVGTACFLPAVHTFCHFSAPPWPESALTSWLQSPLPPGFHF